MNGLLSTVITGISSFAATNIDDIVLLTLLFSQVNATFRPKHIVAGQYLGFSVILLASLPGFLGGLLIPKAWIGLLGLVPIAIGVMQWINPGVNESSVPILPNARRLPMTKLPLLSTIAHGLPIQTYQVAAITVANGGDNIGIYVPLFANVNVIELSVILSLFFGLIGVWCYVAYQLTRHSTIAYALTRYGKAIVPFVLIGLGLFIFFENETYTLFTTPALVSKPSLLNAIFVL